MLEEKVLDEFLRPRLVVVVANVAEKDGRIREPRHGGDQLLHGRGHNGLNKGHLNGDDREGVM